MVQTQTTTRLKSEIQTYSRLYDGSMRATLTNGWVCTILQIHVRGRRGARDGAVRRRAGADRAAAGGAPAC